MRGLLAAPAVLVALAAMPAGRQGTDDQFKVSVIRFYRPASAATTIEGVCEVRLSALTQGGALASRYRVEVAVLDSTGRMVQHSDQTRELPASAGLSGSATAVESFEFDAAPGHYQVRVRLVPGTGDPLERTVDVVAYGAAPPISDLLLANQVRQPASDSEPPGQGEVRRAGLLMRTAPAPALTPVNAVLAWYAEVYPRTGPGSGQLVAEVLGSDGHRIVGTAPRPVTFPAEGGLTRGSIDLSGLPAGEYHLRLRVQLGDSSVVAEAAFIMGSVASVAATAERAGAPTLASAPPADPFERAGDDQLDSMAAPLVYVARNPRELGLYRMLTTDGKRRFLREFWSNPSARVQGSLDRAEFYRFVAFANEAFRERGAAQLPGWNTDRGRVFLRNGRWDEILMRPAATLPYVVWKFTRGRPRWYIFTDRTGLGNYGLLASNDPREAGSRQIGWEGLLGGDATRETYAFLGMDLRNFGIR
jgi:GWxTD domain-containing protein